MNKTTYVHGDYVNSIFQFGCCMNPKRCFFFGTPSRQTGWKMQVCFIVFVIIKQIPIGVILPENDNKSPKGKT